MTSLDPSTLQPAPVAHGVPKCGHEVEIAGALWPCSRPQGHLDSGTGEPCYAMESPRSIREWQQWAAAQAGSHPAPEPSSVHQHRYVMNSTHTKIACSVPGCGDVRSVEDVPEIPEPDLVAEQFSAATGAQAKIRESQQQAVIAPAEDPNDRHGYPAAQRTQHSAEQDERAAEVHPAAYTPMLFNATRPVHISGLHELDLGDYIAEFDDEDEHGNIPGLTVMRVVETE